MEPETLLARLVSSPDLAPFRELVQPLVDYDHKRNSDLLRTLRVYFRCGANASEAADRLFLHRNSLLYRLERAQELTGLNLKDHREALALQLGLLATNGGEDEDQHP